MIRRYRKAAMTITLTVDTNGMWQAEYRGQQGGQFMSPTKAIDTLLGELGITDYDSAMGMGADPHSVVGTLP